MPQAEQPDANSKADATASAELTVRDYFPDTKGSTWRYLSTGSSGHTVEVVVEVAKVEKIKDGFERVIMFKKELRGKFEWPENVAGYLCDGNSVSIICDPSISDRTDGPLLKFPFRNVASWTAKLMPLPGGGSRDGKIVSKMARVDRFKVAAGTFNDVIRVCQDTTTFNPDKAEFRATYWFAPGIGLIRQEYDQLDPDPLMAAQLGTSVAQGGSWDLLDSNVIR